MRMRIRMRWVPSMLVGLAWVTGCGQPQRHPIIPIQPLPQENVTPESDAHRQVAAPLRRLALVVSDLTGTGQAEARQLAESLMAELARQGAVETVGPIHLPRSPVGSPAAEAGAMAPSIEENAQRIHALVTAAAQLQADALLVVEITALDPYPPPRVALRARLLRTGGVARGPAGDMLEMIDDGRPAEMNAATLDRTLWKHLRVFAGQSAALRAEVAEMIDRERQSAADASWREGQTLRRMDYFLDFCAYSLVNALAKASPSPFSWPPGAKL